MSVQGANVCKLVVKVGGSLLTRPDLGPAITNWLAQRLANRQPQAQVNFIVGGGAIVDAFRQLDAIHSLDPVSLHWQCVAALRHTAEILAELISGSAIINSEAAFDSHRRSATAVGRFVIIPEVFFHRNSGDCLPCDWRTTSDSIAALLANKIDANQLVLLKSCDIPKNIDLSEAARREIIDPTFSTIVRSAQVEIVKLP